MRFAIIAGDGIGKEVTAEAVKVLTRVGDVFGRAFEFEHLPWGADYFLETGITLPPNGLQRGQPHRPPRVRVRARTRADEGLHGR
jgi:tartrate dehydrogenase/decarboxylase/D-malate dehydrogenase